MFSRSKQNILGFDFITYLIRLTWIFCVIYSALHELSYFTLTILTVRNVTENSFIPYQRWLILGFFLNITALFYLKIWSMKNSSFYVRGLWWKFSILILTEWLQSSIKNYPSNKEYEKTISPSSSKTLLKSSFFVPYMTNFPFFAWI